MDRQFYTVLLLPDLDRGAYTVTVPLLPGCITEGDSLGEALTHAREAITLFVATLRAGGEEVPREPAPATVLSAAIAEAEETMLVMTRTARS
ncbi:MAG: type II toxin-antitoxin system HicB family antitoxin [Chloroflexi bacterium]|nr:type II toxin-antitoxin system HicB family antitoxin [Chloroflexota bacterium]